MKVASVQLTATAFCKNGFVTVMRRSKTDIVCLSYGTWKGFPPIEAEEQRTIYEMCFKAAAKKLVESERASVETAA